MYGGFACFFCNIKHILIISAFSIDKYANVMTSFAVPSPQPIAAFVIEVANATS